MSVLIITEDSSGRAHEVICGLTKKFLRYLDPDCQTHRISFEPSDDLKDITSSTQWRNRRNERVRLYRRIAQKLRNDDGFVVHHVDADQTWSARERTPSLNAERLETDVVRPVRKQLLEYYTDSDMPEQTLNAVVDSKMSRLFRLIPSWEIEAWLYQNTTKAAQLCPGAPRCQRTPTCHNKLDAWRDDRSALDEVAHVSQALCIGKAHNLALIQGYPTADVFAAGKSLAAAVHAMLACDDLLHAIQRTYETTPGVLEST